MLFRPLEISGLWLIEPEKVEDERGFFSRLYCTDTFLERGLCADYPQWSVSFNKVPRDIVWPALSGAAAR